MALKRPKEVKFDWPQPASPYPSSERSCAFLGPSGCGKTSTAIALLTGPYRDVYSRVYVMSPSCAPGIDPAWDAWRKHVKDYMKVPDEMYAMSPEQLCRGNWRQTCVYISREESGVKQLAIPVEKVPVVRLYMRTCPSTEPVTRKRPSGSMSNPMRWYVRALRG